MMKFLKKLCKHDGLRQLVERMEKVAAKTEIKCLKEQVSELEWRGRRQNLEIHGLPAEANEDHLQNVNEVAKTLDQHKLSSAKVIALHRMRPRQDKVPGIIVLFHLPIGT